MIFFISMLIAVSFAQSNPDKVDKLPLYHGKMGNQYSGYIPINPAQDKYFHYYFVESQSNPQKDPLVLWMNGGPGCSSMDGLLYEHGPFKFEKKKEVSLVENPHSWNKIANVLYLESPGGVGFSYTNASLITDDPTVAGENYLFLKGWFQRYPQFRNNDFYISGESYAGVYVPFLSRVVLGGILNNTFPLNFRGVLVGNGVTNYPGGNPLTVDMPFLFGHGLCSLKMNNAVNRDCNNINSPTCEAALNDCYDMLNDINIYGVYYDCYGGRPQLNHNSSKVAQPRLGGQVPCIDATHADTYLNRADVKMAIHVKSDITWSICNDYVNQNYNRTSESMVDIYKLLLRHNLRVLIYSGDTDFAVPYMDSQVWTTSAGWTEKQAWHQWFFKDTSGSQVAGSATSYQEGLTFVTVKGAGHMVPQFAPPQAFDMFQKFLKNQPF